MSLAQVTTASSGPYWQAFTVDVHADRRGKYIGHMGRYDFFSLSSPTPLQSIGPFALRNNMSINVYGVDNDKEVIIHIRARICYCSNVMVYSSTPPLGTIVD